MKGHEDTLEEYVLRLADIFQEVYRVLHPQGVFYLNLGDTYYSGRGQPRGKDPRSEPRNFMESPLKKKDEIRDAPQEKNGVLFFNPTL